MKANKNTRKVKPMKIPKNRKEYPVLDSVEKLDEEAWKVLKRVGIPESFKSKKK